MGHFYSATTKNISTAHWYIITLPFSKEIEEEENVELRRIMIEKYGWEKFVFDSGCELMSSDEYGKLYRKEFGFGPYEDDEPIIFVEVKNSTPEQDGTFNFYCLRVPPDMVTAREAVAWTFDMSEEEYSPVLET